MEKVKLLVVGSGSIGKRHIRNALHIGIPKENILAMDTREDRLEEVKKLGIKLTFDDFDNLFTKSFNLAKASGVFKSSQRLSRILFGIKLETRVGIPIPKFTYIPFLISFAALAAISLRSHIYKSSLW